MATTAEQVRTYTGPAILSYGFRPFFLAAGAWAALVVALWLPMLSGHLSVPTRFTPLDWHVHELVWGYVPAVVAGFLLTAVPNWTGRLPVTGMPLLALFAAWLVGRLAMLFSLRLGAVPAALLDLLFLASLGGVVAREIIAGRNVRNLKVLALVGLLLAGNAVFHVEAAIGSGRGYGTRLGVAATLLLIMVIGGRIVPSFTRNWLARRGPGRLPAPFERFDLVAMAASAAALASWVLLPEHVATLVLALLAGALNAARLGRWAGDRTAAEPLVLVLHVAFAFVPAGFVLLALSIAAPGIVTASAALHGWTAGAIGLKTLAVMTRASLGHTGQPLTATRPISLIYLAAAASAILRMLAGVAVLREPMLALSAVLWVGAFAGFVIVYAPLLAAARR